MPRERAARAGTEGAEAGPEDDAVTATLRKQLDVAARKRVLIDTVTAMGWIYETIKRV